MGYCDYLAASDVRCVDTLVEYICQTTGTPRPTQRDRAAVRKQVKDFFEQYPHLQGERGWKVLVTVVDYCKAKKRRFARIQSVLPMFRYAYRDGHLPELNEPLTVDPKLEEKIFAALHVEEDQTWRTRLIASSGAHKKEVYRQWWDERGWMLARAAS